MRQSRIYTKEILEVAVKQSLNFTQVCRVLGKFPRGATYQLIKNRIIDYGIDVSHFLGKATHTGLRHTGRCKTIDPNIVLVRGYAYRVKASKLRRSLISIGVKYECAICCINEWMDSPLTLHVDHIDGDWSNCEKNNLRFLCPNCHSQTDNYSKNNK